MFLILLHILKNRHRHNKTEELNLFERDWESQFRGEFRNSYDLLHHHPPHTAHTGASHHASPRRPVSVVRRLDSNQDFSQQLIGELRPSKRFRARSSRSCFVDHAVRSRPHFLDQAPDRHARDLKCFFFFVKRRDCTGESFKRWWWCC